MSSLSILRKVNGKNRYWWMIEGESMYDRSWAVRGMEQFLMDLVAEPEIADFILGKMAGFFFEYTRMLLEKAEGMIDAIGIYNDLGTQNAMFLSPAIYRERIKPHQKRYIEMIKSYGVKVFHLLKTLGAGGGYILAGSHLYQNDIPLENITAIHSANM